MVVHSSSSAGDALRRSSELNKAMNGEEDEDSFCFPPTAGCCCHTVPRKVSALADVVVGAVAAAEDVPNFSIQQIELMWLNFSFLSTRRQNRERQCGNKKSQREISMFLHR